MEIPKTHDNDEMVTAKMLIISSDGITKNNINLSSVTCFQQTESFYELMLRNKISRVLEMSCHCYMITITIIKLFLFEIYLPAFA